MKRFARLLLGCAALALACGATAQDKPALKILVGFAPGGSADVLARLLAGAMQNDFSTVIVENRVGAGGRIALTQVKNAKPDGQTVIVLPSGPMVMFPHVYRKLDYDAVKDFTPVSQIARFQFGLVSGPASNVKSLAEMTARTKADPGTASYGTAQNARVTGNVGWDGGANSVLYDYRSNVSTRILENTGRDSYLARAINNGGQGVGKRGIEGLLGSSVTAANLPTAPARRTPTRRRWPR